MSLCIQGTERPDFVRWIARNWQAWKRKRRTMAEIAGLEELDHLARDIGLSRSDVCILAGKWPDSLDLLSKRLDEVYLDAAELRDTEPQVLRDLQRTCALCASKSRCAHDPSDAIWEKYCPNALTIRALLAERSAAASCQIAREARPVAVGTF